MHDALREHVGTYKDRGFHTEAVTLSEATRASIEAEAMRRFQKLIEDVVSKVWTEKCEPKLEPWIDRLLIGCVSTRVKEAVEKLSGDTIKSAVQARLDQIKETLKA